MNPGPSSQELLPIGLPDVREGGIAVLRALVLCDLVDATALLALLGDQAAAELMRRHDRLSHALMQRCGGREIDRTDGFLVVFERPVQAIDFALNYHRALAEFQAVEKTRLRARVGVHVGEVVLWEGTPDGLEPEAGAVDPEPTARTVVARLMALSGPGQTLVSGLVHALAERSRAEIGLHTPVPRWQRHGHYRLKGVVDPIDVWEVGEPGIAPFRMPASLAAARRILPWWRRTRSIVVAVLLLGCALGAPLYLARHNEAAIDFTARDWVVVGSLRNLTADPGLQEPLEAALRITLEQSRFVNVVSDLKVRQSLVRMSRAEDTPVDRAIGAEVALREGARALILPTVDEFGGRLRVSVEVVDPTTRTTLHTESADGRGVASALASIDEVARGLRGRLGEAIEGDNEPLARVTTTNIDALRAYSLGQRAQLRGRFGDALGLYEQASRLDPDFALAYAGMARVQLSSGDRQAAKPLLDRALALRGQLPPREVMQVEALAATFGPLEPMLAMWLRIGEMYPDHYVAFSNFATFAYIDGNDIHAALDAAPKALSSFNPARGQVHYLLAALALASEDFEASERHLEAAEALGADSLGLVGVNLLAARRELQAAARRLAAVESSGVASNDYAIAIDAGALAVDAGNRDDAMAAGQSAQRAGQRISPLYALLGASVDQSLRAGLGEPVARDGLARWIDDGLRLARSADPIERTAAARSLAFAAWLAADAGDPALARRAVVEASAIAADSGQPIVQQLSTAAQAALAMAEARPADALALLRPFATGRTDLIITRVTLAKALAASGQHAQAMAQWDRIARLRGRAWGEAVALGMLRPFNVGWSHQALLAQAESLAQTGDHAGADAKRARFLQWRAAEALPPALRQRVERLHKPQ
jgi:putative peptide modification system cyclase